LKNIRGYCLFVGLLGLAGFAKETVKAVKNSWEISTWNFKKHSYNAFVDFLCEDEDHADLFDTPSNLTRLVLEFLHWCTEEIESFTIPEIPHPSFTKKRYPDSEISSMKSNICNLFDLAFNVKLGEVAILQAWSRYSNKSNKSKSRYIQTWDAGLLLDFIREQSTNLTLVSADLHYFILLRTVALISFFTILRPCELLDIYLDGMQVTSEGCVVLTSIKTCKTKLTRIFIPKVKDPRICPFLHLMRLIQLNKELFGTSSPSLSPSFTPTSELLPSSSLVWIDSYRGTPLTNYTLRKGLRLIMSKAGIQDMFTAYSYKHAAISYLVKNGVTEAAINEHVDLN
jgi:hypothetical protein